MHKPLKTIYKQKDNKQKKNKEQPLKQENHIIFETGPAGPPLSELIYKW